MTLAAIGEAVRLECETPGCHTVAVRAIVDESRIGTETRYVSRSKPADAGAKPAGEPPKEGPHMNNSEKIAKALKETPGMLYREIVEATGISGRRLGSQLTRRPVKLRLGYPLVGITIDAESVRIKGTP